MATNLQIGDLIQASDINNLLSANDAMVFKGTLGTGGTITNLPVTHSAGWAFKIITAGTYAGKVCEIGDLIVAIIDRDDEDNADTDWIVLQTNLDGAVIGPAASVDDNVAIFSGTSGKLIADSGIKLADKVTANTAITGATKTKITFDSKGLVTAGADLAEGDIPTLPQSKITNLTTDLGAKVTGPASSTNNHLVLFDGTTGKLVKSSGTTLATTFVGGVINERNGANLKIWSGTQAQYNSVSPKDANTLYIITA